MADCDLPKEPTRKSTVTMAANQQRHGICSACGKAKENRLYRWCAACRKAHREETSIRNSPAA